MNHNVTIRSTGNDKTFLEGNSINYSRPSRKGLPQEKKHNLLSRTRSILFDIDTLTQIIDKVRLIYILNMKFNFKLHFKFLVDSRLRYTRFIKTHFIKFTFCTIISVLANASGCSRSWNSIRVWARLWKIFDFFLFHWIFERFEIIVASYSLSSERASEN